MNELYLEHYGILGMHWGVRRYQNADGSLTPAGRERYNVGGQETLFVSGSSKTQDKTSPYYRKKLPKDIRKELDNSIFNEDKIIVGDAPGIDRQVQDYLKKQKYWNVEVYSPGKENRYNANPKGWKVNQVDSDYEPGSKEWLAEKDKAMSDRATKGLAVTLDVGSKATKANIERLVDSMKDVKVYNLYRTEGIKDRFIDSKYASEEIKRDKLMDENSVISNDIKKRREKDIKNLSKFKANGYGDQTSRSITNLGKFKDVEIEVLGDSSENSTNNKKYTNQAINFIEKFNSDKALEGLAKEYYDKEKSWVDKDEISRAEFKKRIKLDYVYVDPTTGSYEAWYDDDGMYGYHSFTDEGSIYDMKVKYRSLNG